jgi:hypothetical protein
MLAGAIVQGHIPLLRALVHVVLDAAKDELGMSEVLAPVLTPCIDEALHVSRPDRLAIHRRLGSVVLCIFVDKSRRDAVWIMTRIRKARVEGCLNLISELVVQWLVEYLSPMRPVVVGMMTLRIKVAEPLRLDRCSNLLERSILVDTHDVSFQMEMWRAVALVLVAPPNDVTPFPSTPPSGRIFEPKRS